MKALDTYKTTFLKIIKFIVIILLVDFVFGNISHKIFYSQKTGKYARTTNAIKENKAKVLIFGSSHAHRHYVPEVFEKELNKVSYNAGAEGQQLLFHLALQEMVLKRTTPELIILNIDDGFLFKSQIAYDRLSDLHPYYQEYRKTLKPIFKLNSDFVWAKFFFKSYQTNSTLVHALRYYASPQIDYQGYRPLFGKVSLEKKGSNTANSEKEYVEEIDQNFVAALEIFIKNAKENNVNVLFVTSPKYSGLDYSDNESFLMISDIATREKVPLINLYNDQQFYKKHELFHDPSHLNDTGARLFTKRLSDHYCP